MYALYSEIVMQCTNRFWQRLLLLRMMEEVPKDTLQIKYEDGLHQGIQAKIHSLKSTSLYEAISYAPRMLRKRSTQSPK